MGCPHEKIIPFNSKPNESMKDEIKKSLSEIERKREIKNKRKTQSKPDNNNHDGSATKPPTHTTFNIENNSGNVIGHVGKIYSQSTKVIKTPSPDIIGAHGHLVKILNDKIKELAETRARDFVKQRKYPNYEAAIGMAYNHRIYGINPTFKRNFSLPYGERRQVINIIKEWNINRFDEILGYFSKKCSRTVTGKIKDGTKKRTSSTPFYELMKREKELLDKIGIGHKDSEVYAALERYYGVSSHKDLEPSKHKDWISHIESIVDKVGRGELDPHDIKL